MDVQRKFGVDRNPETGELPTALLDLLRESAETFPLRIAVIAEKRKISYRDLWRETVKLAGCFRDLLGISPGEKAAILLPNSDQYVTCFFAVLASGGIVVPLSTFLKAEEIHYILTDCQAKVLITSAAFLRSREEKDGCPLEKILRGFLAAGGLERVVLVDERREGFLYLCDLLGRGRPAETVSAAGGDETAVILYTSGTVGNPKGVELSHRNLISNVLASRAAVRIDHRDRFLVILPLFHAFALTVCMLIPVAAGAVMVIPGSLKPFHRLLRRLVFDRVTIIVGIPQLFGLFRNLRIPSFFLRFLRIRLCISGAAPLDGEVLLDFTRKFRIPLLEGYGLTEAAPVVSINPLGGEKPGSVGIPLPGVEVKVVDELEKELPAGETGELIVRGPGVMKGYHRRPEETAQAIRDGWLFTGDLARIDQAGYVYIVDRKKDLIIVHGMNLYPREVEDVIARIPEVKAAAVIGKADRFRGEVPVAVISCREGAVLTEKDVREFCKSRLAAYKVPHLVIFRNNLPLTPTGKVLKRELRKELGYS